MKHQAALKKPKARETTTPGSKVSLADMFKNRASGKNPMFDKPAGDYDKTIITLPLGNSRTGSSSTTGGVWIRTMPRAKD